MYFEKPCFEDFWQCYLRVDWERKSESSHYSPFRCTKHASVILLKPKFNTFNLVRPANVCRCCKYCHRFDFNLTIDREQLIYPKIYHNDHQIGHTCLDLNMKGPQELQNKKETINLTELSDRFFIKCLLQVSKLRSN